VAIVTTSGTAAAELLPAAAEARYAGVPLVLLTADRPPELRGIGAPQTIDQVNLFANFARISLDVLPADMSASDVEQLAVTAWGEAVRRPFGPVHLNMGFREPFVPTSLERPSSSLVPPQPTVAAIDPATLDNISELVSGKRVLVFAGPLDEPSDSVLRLAGAAGWPIVADPLSQLRGAKSDLIVGTGDSLFAVDQVDKPEVVLRLGGTLTSKALNAWLASHPTIPQIVVDEEGRDAPRSADIVLLADPSSFADALKTEACPEEWARSWIRKDRNARAALRGSPFPSEPAVAEVVVDHLTKGSLLYVASSMPIRNVDRFAPSIDARVLANRGANGIDGLISSALGAAATGKRTFVLVGDLSLLHDIGSLATAARLDLPITIVVVNNDGGGIFSFLPQTKLPRHFERLFGTPHGLSFVPIAQAFGIKARLVETTETLASALDEPGLIEIATDRDTEVETRRAAIDRVAAALNN